MSGLLRKRTNLCETANVAKGQQHPSPLAAGKQKCPERCRDLSLREKNRSVIRNQEGTPVKAPPSSQMGKAAWERNPTSSCRTCIALGSNGTHHEHDQMRWVRVAGGA